MFFLPTFAILFNEREEVHNISEGSIAQLVQSVCLTSRGSGVRLPLLPLKETPLQIAVRAFFFSFPLYAICMLNYLQANWTTGNGIIQRSP